MLRDFHWPASYLATLCLSWHLWGSVIYIFNTMPWWLWCVSNLRMTALHYTISLVGWKLVCWLSFLVFNFSHVVWNDGLQLRQNRLLSKFFLPCLVALKLRPSGLLRFPVQKQLLHYWLDPHGEAGFMAYPVLKPVGTLTQNQSAVLVSFIGVPISDLCIVSSVFNCTQVIQIKCVCVMSLMCLKQSGKLIVLNQHLYKNALWLYSNSLINGLVATEMYNEEFWDGCFPWVKLMKPTRWMGLAICGKE